MQQRKTLTLNKRIEPKKQPAPSAQQPKKQHNTVKLVGQLRKCWPGLFDAGKCLPVMIGFTRMNKKERPFRYMSQFYAAMGAYTQTPEYQRALAAGGARFGPDGNPCGEVTEIQQQAARRWLAERGL